MRYIIYFWTICTIDPESGWHTFFSQGQILAEKDFNKFDKMGSHFAFETAVFLKLGFFIRQLAFFLNHILPTAFLALSVAKSPSFPRILLPPLFLLLLLWRSLCGSCLLFWTNYEPSLFQENQSIFSLFIWGNNDHIWLVVSTPLKNINGKDDIPYMKWKITNLWNHQPDISLTIINHY